MNRETYGNKCMCGHFESEHVPPKQNFSLPNVIPETGHIFMHPPDFGKSKREKCKACNCELYNPEKKGWRF